MLFEGANGATICLECVELIMEMAGERGRDVHYRRRGQEAGKIFDDVMSEPWPFKSVQPPTPPKTPALR
jgi:hypothetical protein